MVRALLLYLSRRRRLRRWVETSPVAARLTRRFIAGQSLAQALEVCRKLRAEGIQSTLDHLGESVLSEAAAEASRDACLQALERLAAAGLPSTISVKLTQLGLDLSDEICRGHLEPVAAAAQRLGTRVEVDMESSAYVERTLALVREMHSRHGSVRGVIQAYLRRSQDDVAKLCREGIPLRLCKGAYLEAEDVAFPRKADVDANFLRLARLMLEHGPDPAIATHDTRMLDGALKAAREFGLGPDKFEFQMLYGIRRDLQRKLVRQGFRLRLYVPYGSAWYPYFMRRLAERPANLLFLARNLFRR